MKKRDKIKNYEQANLMLEQSYLKSKGLINEVDQKIEKAAEQIANNPKVQSELEEKLKNLSPEQIEKLEMDIQKAINQLRVESKNPTDNMSYMDSKNKTEITKEKVADTLESVASAGASTLLVPIIPVAIGTAIGSVAAGFGVFILGITALYGLAKAIKKISS